jgi:transposase InsO family protein
VLRWSSWCGWTEARCCDAIGVSQRTIRDWRSDLARAEDRLQAKPLGAPPVVATPTDRCAVESFLDLVGTDVGAPTLQDHFPNLSRAECARLLAQARWQRYHHDRARLYRELTWSGVGRIWAMDYTEPPLPVDGVFPSILVVRDLASGVCLAADPVDSADAAATVATLTRLCATHGAPLVIKSDNGSHFRASDVARFLRSQRIVLLPSPPYTPSYNGACEAGNGAIKTRTAILAGRDGNPALWTCRHVEAARLWSNRVDADRRGATPEERWSGHAPIPNPERERLRAAVLGAYRRLRQAYRSITTISLDAMWRRAVADALTGIGYLTTRSRPVRQPITRFLSA